MPKEKKTQQVNLVGTIISTADERIKDCLEHIRMKTTLRRIYPGQGFEVGISDKDRDTIDGIDDPQKRRTFILKKMRPAAGVEIAAKREGMVFQDDLDMLVKLIFETRVAHMSKETYEAFMKERKGEKTEDLKKVAKKVKEKAQEQEEEKERTGILQAESEMIPA